MRELDVVRQISRIESAEALDPIVTKVDGLFFWVNKPPGGCRR